MSVIKPFRALRPVPEKAEKVSCVPYDVVSDAEVREFIADNPLSFLRVTRPEAEFPKGEKPSQEDVLAKAKENLDWFIGEKILAHEAEPAFYIYRLSNESHTQTGIVACCSLDEYETNLIKKHEKTRPDKVEDRTNHILALQAQTGLIFLAFRNTGKTSEMFAEAVQNKPIYDFVFCDGTRQTIWEITQTEKWSQAFEEIPAIYVADGHHRIESANLARKKMAEKNAEHTGTEDYNFVVAGIFPSEDLKILAYNRVVRDLNGLSAEEFLQKLAETFIVSETTEKEPSERGNFNMYLDGKWFDLKFAVSYIREPDPIERLDVSILQDNVLGPILGIDDPRTNERIAFVGGSRGTPELENLVDGGEYKVAFSMFPTTMDDLFAVADVDEIMPPKSTWFEPKLKDGLLIHLI